jgi:hypothetical protein
MSERRPRPPRRIRQPAENRAEKWEWKWRHLCRHTAVMVVADDLRINPLGVSFSLLNELASIWHGFR